MRARGSPCAMRAASRCLIAPATTTSVSRGDHRAPVARPLGWYLGALLSPAALALTTAPLFLLGIWACAVTGRALGVADHRAMVWDEIVAFLLVLAIVPRALDWQAAAFVLFRAFDIAKPPPIRALEH